MDINQKDRTFRHSQILERGVVFVPRYGDKLSNYSIDSITGDLLFKTLDGAWHRVLVDNKVYSLDYNLITRVLEAKPFNQTDNK